MIQSRLAHPELIVMRQLLLLGQRDVTKLGGKRIRFAESSCAGKWNAELEWT